MNSKPGTPLWLVVLFASALAATPAAQLDARHTFDDDRQGQVPAGFLLSAMRQPAPGIWTVRRAGPNGYLVHDADAAQSTGFAMAVAADKTPRDIVVSARLRLAGGARAGGILWRYVDANTYYAAILDLHRQELMLYRVAGGNRIRLESADDLELDVNAWHTLKIVHNQDRITVSLGGIRVFQDNDHAGRQAGADRAGFVATGDSEVWFDDLTVQTVPPDRRGR